MSRGRSGGGVSGSMGGLSLSGRPAASASWGQGGRGSNYGLGFGMSSSSGNMMSEHSRRKQDDEILAELERDPTANGNAAAAAAAAADKAAADESHSRGRKSRTPHDGDRGGRDKSYTTSLPREDAHRFRATVRPQHTHTIARVIRSRCDRQALQMQSTIAFAFQWVCLLTWCFLVR